jgi:hypothetical protein
MAIHVRQKKLYKRRRRALALLTPQPSPPPLLILFFLPQETPKTRAKKHYLILNSRTEILRCMHAKRNAIATTIWRWSQEQKCYYREQESKAAGEEDNPTDSKRNPKPPVFACVPLFVCGCARVRVTLFAGEQEKKQSEEEEEEARTEQGPPFAHLPPEESRASPESLYCLASDSPTP